jgi:predicted DNA-binding protein with PD1-like motif
MPYVTEGASPITVHALRLRPGEDLRAELEAFVRARELAAAFIVASVGSLSVARLRYAGRDEAVELCGDLELVALSGTISRGGEGHLHAAVADADGNVTGGHLLAGSVVRTTAEIVLADATLFAFARALGPDTPWRELTFAARSDGRTAD